MGIAFVVTKLRQFKQPDLRGLNNQPWSKKISGRDIYNLQRCADYGLKYIGIGRTSGLYS